jgi:hypothetical protein
MQRRYCIWGLPIFCKGVPAKGKALLQKSKAFLQKELCVRVLFTTVNNSEQHRNTKGVTAKGGCRSFAKAFLQKAKALLQKSKIGSPLFQSRLWCSGVVRVRELLFRTANNSEQHSGTAKAFLQKERRSCKRKGVPAKVKGVPAKVKGVTAK